MKLPFYSATQLAQGIQARTLTAVEVLEAYLTQIEQHNPALNAVVTLNTAEARRQARAADAAIQQGHCWGTLHGVPITFKDLFETAGLRTTFGDPALAQFVPSQDAPLVTQLRQAGAIVLGKTNLPQGGADFQTVNPIFGRTQNPWDLSRTPGGSTGGGAAAIAAGLCPLDLGNDLGGSLRIPAHFCGVYSLKPTEHRVASSLRSNPRRLRHMIATGAIARSVEDLKLCLSIIEGANGFEWEVPPIPSDDPPQRPLADYRFAWCDAFGALSADRQTRTALRQMVEQLRAAGCQVEYATPPGFDFPFAWHTFGKLCTCQIALGQQASLRGIGRTLAHALPLSRLLGGEMVAGFVQGTTLSLQDYMETLTARDRLTRQMEQFLAQWDAWLCPVTPGPAFTHRPTRWFLRDPLEVDDQTQPYWLWGMGFTSVFNLTGNPVVTVPLPQEGLPLGVQVVGRRWQDRDILAIAQALNPITGGFRPPPGY